MIEPRSLVCTVTLELPWEVAEALVRHWPGIIGPIQKALEHRVECARVDAEQKAVVERQRAENIRAWTELASWAEAELDRRSNRPGQRRSVLKQLAAERNMSLQDLERIVRLFGSKAQSPVMSSSG